MKDKDLAGMFVAKCCPSWGFAARIFKNEY